MRPPEHETGVLITWLWHSMEVWVVYTFIGLDTYWACSTDRLRCFYRGVSESKETRSPMWRTLFSHRCMCNTKEDVGTYHFSTVAADVWAFVAQWHQDIYPAQTRLVPNAFRQETAGWLHVTIDSKLLTSQVILQVPKEMKHTWRKVRTVRQVVQNLPFVWRAVTLLFEMPSCIKQRTPQNTCDKRTHPIMVSKWWQRKML